jgi:hypothetical protein
VGAKCHLRNDAAGMDQPACAGVSSRGIRAAALWEFRHDTVAIVYLCPRAGSSNPRRLTIRERGKVVFSLEWQNGDQLRSCYRPGEWGRVIRACLKTPSGMRV